MDWTELLKQFFTQAPYFLIAVFGLKYVYDKESEQAEKVTDKITTLAEAVAENTKTLAVLVNEMRDERGN